MLKKNDLAKQFELVVQQEIKNYNDSLNFILQSIRDLKISIEQVHQESLENYASLNSMLQSQSSQIDRIICNQSEDAMNLARFKNDNNSINQKIEEKIKNLSDREIEISKKNEYNKNLIDVIQQNIEIIEDEIKGHSITISTSLDSIRFKLAKDLNKMKEEILSLPSDSLQIKQELEDKIATHAIDVKGIMREIICAKKSTFILEKKVENIYMLINRLNNPKAVS